MQSTFPEQQAAAIGPTDTRLAMIRALQVMLAAGAALVLFELSLRWSRADLIGLGACVATATLVGGVVLLRFDRLHRTAFPMLLASGTLMVTAALGFAGDGAVFYPLFLLCVSLTAYLMLSRNDAHLQTALAAAAYGLTGATPGRWLAAAALACLTGLVAARLIERRAARRNKDIVESPMPLHRQIDEQPAERSDLAA